MPLFRRAAVVALLVSLSTPAMASDCAALLQQHLRTDLALPFESFDQADASGWRPLGAVDCDAESAQRPNLVSVERLQRCFGQPYKRAQRCRAEP